MRLITSLAKSIELVAATIVVVVTVVVAFLLLLLLQPHEVAGNSLTFHFALKSKLNCISDAAAAPAATTTTTKATVMPSRM